MQQYFVQIRCFFSKKNEYFSYYSMKMFVVCTHYIGGGVFLEQNLLYLNSFTTNVQFLEKIKGQELHGRWCHTCRCLSDVKSDKVNGLL